MLVTSSRKKIDEDAQKYYFLMDRKSIIKIIFLNSNQKFDETTVMDWRTYQEETAELFKRLGCSAEVDKLIQGVRAEHRIDVWVVFTKFGFQNRWAVECKYWNSNVPKEKVMALKSIVEDVGADRGVIMSKTGFQSGAIRAAAYTNITLTSLEDLEQSVQDDLIQSALYNLESSATRLIHELQNLYKVDQLGPNSWVSNPLPGVDGNLIRRAGGRLSTLKWGFDNIRLKKPPYPVDSDVEGDQIIVAPTIESFVENASFLLRDIEKLLTVQMKNVGKTTRSDDDQA